MLDKYKREIYYNKLLQKCHIRHKKSVHKKIDWEKLSIFIKQQPPKTENFTPYVSDNFQIGYNGAYEHDF